MYYVYVLRNKTVGKFYVGYSSNLEKRVKEHNQGRHKTKYTRKQPGKWILVLSEEYESRNEAMRREKKIKGWKSGKKIAELVEQSR